MYSRRYLDGVTGSVSYSLVTFRPTFVPGSKEVSPLSHKEGKLIAAFVLVFSVFEHFLCRTEITVVC